MEELIKQKMQLVRLHCAHVYERTRPNGRVLEVRGVPLTNGGFMTTYLDVTHRHQKAPTEDSGYDKLTKLPKRAYMQRQLWQALKTLSVEELLCLHCIDLKDFSTLRDLHGQVVSDFVLKETAMRLRTTPRDRSPGTFGW